MKKYIISVLLLSAGFSFAFAQTTDTDTSSTNSCAIITSNLRYLSRDANGGTDVSVLQDFLNTHSYLKSQPTGFFGSATRRAVIAFQNDNGLRATPPGFVGPGTRAKIQAIDCNDNSAVNIAPTTNTVTNNNTPTYTVPATQPTNNTYQYQNTTPTPVTVTQPTTTSSNTCSSGYIISDKGCVLLPPNSTISASASSVVSGQPVSITYQVSNAGYCVANGGWYGTYYAPVGHYDNWAGDKGYFYPTTTTTYGFTCYNSNGSSQTQNVTVNVTPAPVATPSSINVLYPTTGTTFTQGQPMTISWQAVGPNSTYVIGESVASKSSIGTYSASQAHCNASDKCYISWTPSISSSNIKVLVSEVTSNIYGYSGVFTITAPQPVQTSISVLYPTAGMTLTQGQPMTISWQAVGPNSNYTLGYGSNETGKGAIGTYSASQAHCDASDKCYISWTPTFSSPAVTIGVSDYNVSGLWGNSAEFIIK